MSWVEANEGSLPARCLASADEDQLLAVNKTATALGIAMPTAKQWWAYARAWLSVELRDEAA